MSEFKSGMSPNADEETSMLHVLLMSFERSIVTNESTPNSSNEVSLGTSSYGMPVALLKIVLATVRVSILFRSVLDMDADLPANDLTVSLLA